MRQGWTAMSELSQSLSGAINKGSKIQFHQKSKLIWISVPKRTYEGSLLITCRAWSLDFDYLLEGNRDMSHMIRFNYLMKLYEYFIVVFSHDDQGH